MSNYSRGYHLERRVQTHLEDDGYFTLRSGGSKTPVDVAAFKPGQVLFVQVKISDITHDEWNELFWLAYRIGTVPVLASRERRKLAFHRITGPHTARSHLWPRERFEMDEAA